MGKTFTHLSILCFLMLGMSCGIANTIKQSQKLSISTSSNKIVIPLIEDENVLLFEGLICNKKATFKFDNHVTYLYATQNTLDKIGDSCREESHKSKQKTVNGRSFSAENNMIARLDINNLNYGSILSQTVSKLEGFDFLFGSYMMNNAIWQIDFKNKMIVRYTSFNDIEDKIVFTKIGAMKKLSSVFIVPIGINGSMVNCEVDLGYNSYVRLKIKSFNEVTKNIENIEQRKGQTSDVVSQKETIFKIYNNAPIILSGNKIQANVFSNEHVSNNLLGLAFFRENYQSIILDFVNGGFYVLPKEK